MEDDLDKIEDGGCDWHKIIADFYPGFADQLKTASTDGDEETDLKCEKCGSPMIRRMGKYGKYLACSNYPACSNIVSDAVKPTSIMSVKYFKSISVMEYATSVGIIYLPSFLTYLRLFKTEIMEA